MNCPLIPMRLPGAGRRSALDLLSHYGVGGSPTRDIRSHVLLALCREALVAGELKDQARRVPYTTKPDLASELIRLTRSWIGCHITRRVAVDGGYSNCTLGKDRPTNVHITDKVRKESMPDAPVAPHNGSARRGRPRKKGTERPKPAQTFNYPLPHWDAVLTPFHGKETMLLVSQYQAIRYRVGGNAVFSTVLVRDPDGDDLDTVFFETDINARDEENVNRFSHRWSIEIMNQERKHLSGHARGRKAKPSLPRISARRWHSAG